MVIFRDNRDEVRPAHGMKLATKNSECSQITNHNYNHHDNDSEGERQNVYLREAGGWIEREKLGTLGTLVLGRSHQ